jgi:predicted PurR-regulated permease PerM
MASANHSSTADRLMPILAVVVLSGVILYWASKIIIPLALAVLLAFLLAPLARGLQKLKIPRFPAVLIVVLGVLGLLYGILHVVFVQIDELARDLHEHTHTISRKFEDLLTDKRYLWNQIGPVIEEINQNLKSIGAPDNPGQTEPVPVSVQKPTVTPLSLFPQVALPLLELVLILGFIFILVVYILMRPEDLRDRLLRLGGRGRMALTATTLDEAGNRISRVMLRQLGTNCAFGFILWGGLALIGVPYAFLWGFLAALLRFIPYVGTIVSLLFPLTLSFAVTPGWVKPLSVLAFFTVEELLIGYVAEPLLFSESAGASPFALLFAAAFWTWIWGPIGLILSNPLTVCLAVLGRQIPGLQFFDILLSPREVPSRAERYYHQLLAHDRDTGTEILEEALHEDSLPMLCDRILLPALIQAQQDQARGDIPPPEVEYVLQSIQETFEEALALKPTDDKESSNTQPSGAGAQILAIGAGDATDTIAVRFLEKTLGTQGYAVESVAFDKLSAPRASQENGKEPSLVCLVAVGPISLADSRRACKRVRGQIPKVPLVVALWGTTHDREKATAALMAAGADAVTFSMAETSEQADSLINLSPVKRAAG